MKALQIVRIRQPLEERDVPTPQAGRGEIVVRVAAAGICHSDAHYRAGTSPVGPLPLTPGHEVAGTVTQVGEGVTSVSAEDRVALHYLVTCGVCEYCVRGLEQFCTSGKMIGKHRDGGYAEFVVVPAQNAVRIPTQVSFDEAAIMMCSTATAYHALRRARLSAGDTVAILGVGGLGMSAVQLARACGAAKVYAVDIDPVKLAQAEAYGAVPVAGANAVAEIRAHTGGRGVDVAVELAGLPVTQEQAVQLLAVHGRASLAGITQKPFSISSYATVINSESEIIGVSDHLRGELTTLMDFAARGLIDLRGIVGKKVPLDPLMVNEVLDSLQAFKGIARTVISFSI